MPIFHLSIILLFALLTGCATSGARVSSIPSALQSSGGNNGVMSFKNQLVAIRWPVAVESNARDRLIENYSRFSKVVYAAGAVTEENYDNAPELTFAASTYFAAELFQALSRSMPEANIIMQPMVIGIDRTTTKLIEKPLMDDDLPATIIINITDLSGGNFPFMGTMLSYTVRVSPQASYGNCGLLLAMEEELKRSSISKLSNNCSSQNAEAAPNPIWYLGFSDDDRLTSGLHATDKLPLSDQSVVLFPPVQLFSMNILALANKPEYVKESRPNSPSDVQRMVLHPHLVNLANVISTAPMVTVNKKVSDATLASYANSYDLSLAAALRSGQQLNSRQMLNIQLIKKLLVTELQVRQERDTKMTTSILGGDYGAGFRKQRDKSYDGFNSMMTRSWASAVLITASTPAATSPMEVISRNMEMLNRHTAHLDSIGADLYTQFTPSLDVMESEYLSFEGKKIPLQKAGQQSLRKSLKALYVKHKK